MPLPLVVVDAFTDTPFRGNPAAVCLLDAPRPDDWMQQVAQEMNLSETAFPLPDGDGWHLRWFTPKTEVDLCGHATLATAHVLWSEAGVDPERPIRFRTASGTLLAHRRDDLVELDFPAHMPVPAEPPASLAGALGAEPEFTGFGGGDYLALLDSERTMRSLEPDFAQLRELGTRGVIVTAPADDPDVDFVSRFFAPGVGIDEDPVTGSAHCCLGPFWRERLGKDVLRGFQASARGGIVEVRIAEDRVHLAGHAVTVVRGQLLA